MKILLKEIREKKKMSLRQLEYLTGIPKSTLYGIEKTGCITLDVAEKIAKGLNIKITDLFISEYK